MNREPVVLFWVLSQVSAAFRSSANAEWLGNRPPWDLGATVMIPQEA